MSLPHFFRHHHQLPTRVYELEFEYINGRQEHEATLAYVVATNENHALLDLKTEMTKHRCELKKIVGQPKRIEADEFDDYVHSRWPQYLKSLVSKTMINNHGHTVYVLPPIKLMG